MLTKHFFGNSMQLNSPLDFIIKGCNKLILCCQECGDVFEIDINSWAEAENFICNQCKEELKNEKN